MTAPRTSMPPGSAASDHLSGCLLVPAGSRVFVVSDLRLSPNPTESTEIAAAQFAQVVEGLSGGGVVVLAGDVIDLKSCHQLDPAQALAAHPRLLTALRKYAGRGGDHHVVMLAGEADAEILDGGIAGRRLHDEYGFELCRDLEIVFATGTGERRVRIEHGQLLGDAVADSESDSESESLAMTLPTWLEGADALFGQIDPRRFVGSRFFYRRLLGPVGGVVAATLVGAIVVAAWSQHATARYVSSALVALGATIVLASKGFVDRSTKKWAPYCSGADRDVNLAGRSKAEQLRSEGWSGLISAHTRRPELTELGDGCFYANCGATADGTTEMPSRFGLPPVFGLVRQTSWIELEGAADLQVRLSVSRCPTSDASMLESLLRRHGGLPHTPRVMAELPSNVARVTPSTWPGASRGVHWDTLHARRRAAAGLTVAGAVNLVSALTPPVAERLDALTHWVPLTIEQTATALAAVTGVGLLLVARGVRRGQHRAWLAAVALLAFSTILHVIKGLDTEEAVVSAVMLAYLVSHAAKFRAQVDRPSARRALAGLSVVVIGSVVVGIAAVKAGHGRASRLPLRRVVVAVLERLIGITTIDLGRAGRFLSPALAAVGFAAIIAAAWSTFRPTRTSAVGSPGQGETRHAHDIVEAHGDDTLAYFALRHDKQWFFQGNSLVAYTVRFGVCVVSPDPVGPSAERNEVWSAFVSFAHSNGWTIAIMAAGADWLSTYHASGMRDLYIGDEAVVDAQRFTLDGSHNKGLRNNAAKLGRKGYHVEFLDPVNASAALRDQLNILMTQSRRGEVERGFSMTLGRIFDPSDRGLLLAVCLDESDQAVAFCQFTPASAIDGYSLDLMRRSELNTTNGLTDFVVTETIGHLAATGRRGLGLNFATMRAVIAGEISDSPMSRTQGWALRRLSPSMQIESLWRYNAKFDPDWRPRYAVFESLDNLLPAALAVASVESWWELPLIGRFLATSAPTSPVRER